MLFVAITMELRSRLAFWQTKEKEMGRAKSTHHRYNSDNSWLIISLVLGIILVVVCASGAYIVKKSISTGVDSAQEAFTSTYTEMRDKAYDSFRDSAYEIAEKQNHVSNDISISIDAIKEKSILEVLKVSDVVYVINDSSESKSGTTSWLEVSGTGIFTVNLSAAECLVDNGRHYVLLRVPSPVLDSQNISIDSWEILKFAENKWNRDNSAKSGEALARNQLNEAKGLMQEDFESSEMYSKLAISSTETMLKALVQGLNSDIPDIQVDVEFY